MAAILNSALPNGAPLPVELSVIQSTLSGTDRNAIRALDATLDTYNNSGEDVEIGEVVPPADPQAAQDAAYIKIADCD